MTISRRILSFVGAGLFSIPFVTLCGCLSNAVAQGVEAQQRPPAQGTRIADPLAVFPKDRISQAIDRRATVRLSGHVHRQARPEFYAGPVAGETKMPGMILVLKRDADQQEALDELSEALEDPSSPMFHQWLTPESFGLHFGLSQNDLDRITEWLRSEGFTIDDVPAGHWMVVFSGTAAQVESTFRVKLQNYRIDGNLYLANSNDPEVPQALSGIIQSISGLHNFPPTPASGKPTPQPVFANGPNGPYFLEPSDFSTIYNINPQFANGIRGNGVNIAVISPCAAASSVAPVAQAFWALEGISRQSLASWYYNGTPQTCQSPDIGEAQLDTEWAGAIASGAQIWLVSSGSSDSLLGAVTGVVNSGVGASNTFAQVISMSYSSCESQPYDLTWNSLWQQAHTHGITGIVASGDSGAAGCDASTASSATHGLGINGYCSSGFAVCVGGTQFNDVSSPGSYWSSGGSAIGYIPELAWNESLSSGGNGLLSSGGGYSTFSLKPTWQTGNTTQYRGVPDIALTAAAHDGYRVCVDTSDCSTSPKFLYVDSGTSAPAPSFAGIVALLVQQTGQLQGNLNQTMYTLASRSDLNIFHDVTQGNNTVPGLTGFSAGLGWDPVTGLGSMDVNAMISNWSASSNPLPAVTLSTSHLSFGNQAIGTTSAAQNVTLTNSGTAALTITSISIGGYSPGDFTQTNNCGSTVASGGFCTIGISFMPVANGPRTASLTISDNAAGSPHTVSLTGIAPSTYHVFPQIADGYASDGSYIQSTVIVINSDPSTASPSCTLQSHGLSIGGQTSVSFTISGTYYLYTTPGNTQAIQAGYASLQCSSNVEAQLLYTYYTRDGAKVSEATVFSSPSATSLRIFADERGGMQLALAIANDSSQPANYTINVYDSNGVTRIGTTSLPTVNPGQHQAAYLDQLLTIPQNYFGIVDIIANSGTASVIGVSYTGNLFTTIPAAIIGSTSATASTYHVFPQIADGYASDGSYIQSTVIVINSNPSTTSPSCTLQFHGLSIGGQTSVPLTNNSGTYYLYTTPGNTQALQTGYASLQCSSNVEAQLLYAYYNSAGTKASEATVFSSPSATSLRILADERGSTKLALAVANDSSQNASYTINVYASSGVNLIGSTSLPVNAGQNHAAYLDQLVTIPSNYLSIVDIIANSGTASVIGISYTGSLFTTIPAAILK
jgi:subtilase family serine protease